MKTAILRLCLGLIGMSLYRDDQIPAERRRLSGVITYEVLVNDFDRIEQEAKSVGTDLQLACAFIPVAVMLTVTLKTVPISSNRLYERFFIVMAVCYVFGVIFGFRAFVQRGRLTKFMNRIRAQQVGPVGEKGKEIRPSELASLEQGAAPELVAQPQAVITESVVTAVIESTGEQK